jgi:hypothetical protein
MPLNKSPFAWIVPLACICPWFQAVGSAAPTGRVELIVLSDNPLGADFHRWMRGLSQAGVENIRMQSNPSGQQPGIAVQGTAERPVYVVTGILTTRSELVLPGGRFQLSDATRIAQWLADLAAHGPPERREPRGAFGLTNRQAEVVARRLSPSVGFSTKGQARDQVARRLAGSLQPPPNVTAGVWGVLGEEPLAEELSELSCGTALAYILRLADLSLVPRSDGEQVAYALVPADESQQAWPVGWPAEKPVRELVPVMFEFLNVEINGVSAATAIEAIGGRLKVPVLVDHAALSRHGIDPAKVTVTLPAGRSTYSLILQKVLFQARLKYEVRVDDAGKPLVWITTIKPAHSK